MSVEITADPTGGGVFVAGARRFPDFRGPEVVLGRIRVADILNDGQFALPEKFRQTVAGRMKTDVAGDRDDLFGGNGQLRAKAVVIRVPEWNEGVEAVVSPGQLNEDQDPSLALRRGIRCQGVPGEAGGSEAAQGDQSNAIGAGGEKFTSGKGKAQAGSSHRFKGSLQRWRGVGKRMEGKSK